MVSMQAARQTARWQRCPARSPRGRWRRAGGPHGGSARRPAAAARAAAATPAPTAAAAPPASTGRERAALPGRAVRAQCSSTGDKLYERNNLSGMEGLERNHCICITVLASCSSIHSLTGKLASCISRCRRRT